LYEQKGRTLFMDAHFVPRLITRALPDGLLAALDGDLENATMHGSELDSIARALKMRDDMVESHMRPTVRHESLRKKKKRLALSAFLAEMNSEFHDDQGNSQFSTTILLHDSTSFPLFCSLARSLPLGRLCSNTAFGDALGIPMWPKSPMIRLC
jgi:hypothetical protein